MGTFSEQFRKSISDVTGTLIDELKAEMARQRAERQAHAAGTPNPEPGQDAQAFSAPLRPEADETDIRIRNLYRHISDQKYDILKRVDETIAKDRKYYADQIRELRDGMRKIGENIEATAQAADETQKVVASSSSLMSAAAKDMESLRKELESHSRQISENHAAFGRFKDDTEHATAALSRSVNEIAQKVDGVDRYANGIAKRIDRIGEAWEAKHEERNGQIGRIDQSVTELQRQIATLAVTVGNMRDKTERGSSDHAKRIDALEAGEAGVTAVALLPDLDAAMAKHEREFHADPGTADDGADGPSEPMMLIPMRDVLALRRFLESAPGTMHDSAKPGFWTNLQFIKNRFPDSRFEAFLTESGVTLRPSGVRDDISVADASEEVGKKIDAMFARNPNIRRL